MVLSFFFSFFFSEVEDVAKATLFLLSENASMINGITMSVDGGALAIL